MIGYLEGILFRKEDDHLVINVRGVGFLVFVSERTMRALPETGSTVALHTNLLVREDLLQLFGFLSRQEREWHQLLMSVQGIGSKAAMSILGALGGDGVGRAIAMENSAAIASAKGVGPKIAQRVVMDLKGKASSIMAMTETEPIEISAPADSETETVREKPQEAAKSNLAQSEALSALANLGYGPVEAAAAVAAAFDAQAEPTTAEVIRAALKTLAPKS
ncbi:MAG: Holliday junction branch migration protein RuvA [Aestuariivita sp.]|nr:Holliday junction branch migration protein RuvA [Aestuariivita sp.]MCY4203505.1 Holliday junction branch migration protein RuvA [Aestuariivita sp.]MCY4288088.1 Holliday junction branch migration protein RuvA [Aestuariivita sp.]MCY4346344.1 Holliday junction branch migration protein RuvA [Aestuariivita sp.]